MADFWNDPPGFRAGPILPPFGQLTQAMPSGGFDPFDPYGIGLRSAQDERLRQYMRDPSFGFLREFIERQPKSWDYLFGTERYKY